MVNRKPYWQVPELDECNEHFYKFNCCDGNLFNNPVVQLKDQMRLLWEQHVAWTRMTIISIIANLPDEKATTKRLLRNAKDFEKAFQPFYGEEVAHNLGILITDHLEIAAELVKAAKAENSHAAAKIEKRWYQNADEIVNLLACINHYWSEEEMKKMWYDHLALTKSEAIAILTKNYTKSTAIFDQIEKLALIMADDLTSGIMKQFPKIKRTN